LAEYPRGIVDRVVKLSNSEYEVHYIGVNWPHHVFVNQDFKVVGATTSCRDNPGDTRSHQGVEF